MIENVELIIDMYGKLQMESDEPLLIDTHDCIRDRAGNEYTAQIIITDLKKK